MWLEAPKEFGGSIMFKATDEYGKEVMIDTAQESKPYFCPICNGLLVVKAKKSKSVAAHFAHKSRVDCDTFSHDMSDWHKEWQNRFPIKNREVPLPFDNPCHRADVLACGYVIEFQHSPISLEEFDERNRFYTALGKKVVWIFDVMEKYAENRFTKIEPSYIYDGKYTDTNGVVKKKWIEREFRIGNKLVPVEYFPGVGDESRRGISYIYGKNEKNAKQKSYEWHWKRPLSNLKNYNPLVDQNIIVFLEFEPGWLHKVIWCKDEIDFDIADSISANLGEGMHEKGQFWLDSVDCCSLYFQYRDKFVIRSDFRYFSATEYSINDFIAAIKNRKL